jgi:hypothetical protein
MAAEKRGVRRMEENALREFVIGRKGTVLVSY